MSDADELQILKDFVDQWGKELGELIPMGVWDRKEGTYPTSYWFRLLDIKAACKQHMTSKARKLIEENVYILRQQDENSQ